MQTVLWQLGALLQQYNNQKDSFEFTEQIRDVVENPMIMQNPQSLQIIEAVYAWMGNHVNEFLMKGLQIEELEELRGIGLKYLNGANYSE